MLLGCKKDSHSHLKENDTFFNNATRNSEKINRFDLEKFALNFAQFLNRFNGEDTIGLTDPNVLGTQKRSKIVAALFIRSFYKEENKELLDNFLKDVCFKTPNTFMHEDSSLFAKAFCEVLTRNKETITVKLTLRYIQNARREAKWELFGIQSTWLDTIFLNQKATDAIFPNDHDFNFVDMTKKLQNSPFSLMDSNQLDQMSIFLTLIQQKQLSISHVNKLDLYYLGIPNWGVIIGNTGLSKAEGGWKIKRVIALTQQQKSIFAQDSLYEIKFKIF